jgi:hypothetical protein
MFSPVIPLQASTISCTNSLRRKDFRQPSKWSTTQPHLTADAHTAAAAAAAAAAAFVTCPASLSPVSVEQRISRQSQGCSSAADHTLKHIVHSAGHLQQAMAADVGQAQPASFPSGTLSLQVQRLLQSSPPPAPATEAHLLKLPGAVMSSCLVGGTQP